MSDPSIMVTPLKSIDKIAVRVASIQDLRPAWHGATFSQLAEPTGSSAPESSQLKVEESVEEIWRLIDETRP